jgi:hypothetical protein
MQDLHEFINKILKTFDYKDGQLFWKEIKQKRVLSKPAGSINKNGYVQVKFGGKLYKLHRIIFLMHYKYMPKSIDHMDGNTLNNRIENLRACTNSENMYNRAINKNNRTGVKGVGFEKRTKMYRARCAVNSISYTIGRFKFLEDAAKAIEEFRKKHHGEFARHK